MAIKPITDKQLVDAGNVNRETQTSQRNLNTRGGGNDSQTIIPGIDLSKQYSITLKDIDTSIMSYIKNVIKPTVQEANEKIKVSVMYGNEERWVAARKRGVLRDKQGQLMLPLIMLKRTNIAKNELLSVGAEHDVKREHTEVTRTQKWSKHNRYDNFAIVTGQKPVYESIVTTVPNYVDITYEFALWTNFIEQMNPLVETFVEFNNTYWGDSSDYKFLSILDSISDASEMMRDGERFIKSTFSLTTKGYLLPEDTNSVVTNKISNAQRALSPKRIVFKEGLPIDKPF